MVTPVTKTKINLKLDNVTIDMLNEQKKIGGKV
jgi:hypothetical protein